MQRNEVVDLQKFRNGEANASVDATETQCLAAGTRLLVGQYKIEGYLNCGGFGITYIARDSLGRKVVIKECFPSEMVYRRGNSMVSRSPKYAKELTDIVHHFVTEAHSLANARHNNVVHVHQIFEENATAYMAMDFIDGPDLLDLVESNHTLSARQVETITRKMLEAIRFVHDRGMLHRDISPDNILIDKSGEPVLIDFGAARQHSRRQSGSTPRMKFVKDGYSPQEFYVADTAHGPWSDLYALAATIYHVITGDAPPDAQSRLAAIAAKTADPYKPLAGAIKGYPGRFLKAIDTALGVLPESRFQSASEWLERIGPAQPEQKSVLLAPVTAVMESLSVFEETEFAASVKDASKNRKLLAASVAALVVGGGVLLMQVSTWSGGSERVAGNGPDALSVAPLLADQVIPESGASAAPQLVAEAPATNLPPVLLPPDVASSPAFRMSALTTGDRNFRAPETQIESAAVLPAFRDIRPDGARPSDGDALLAIPAAHPPETSLTAIDLTSPTTTETTPLGIEFVSLAPVALTKPSSVLSQPEGEEKAFADTSAPDYSPLDDAATAYSRWEADLPFRPELRTQGAETAVVVRDLAEEAELPEGAKWLAEGITILAVNGSPLRPDIAFGEQLVSDLSIAEDGTTRAEIWYRLPSEDVLDQGLIVVPVVRATQLADGTRLETRQQGQSWVTRVIALGEAKTDLQIGDLIIGNTAGSTRFADPETVEAALNALAQSGVMAAEFSVLRRGARMTAAWDYAQR